MEQGFESTSNELQSMIGNSRITLVEKCLKLAQILEYPDLNIQDYKQRIQSIGKSITKSGLEHKSNIFKISILNEHLFQHQRFRGNVEDYFNPQNNFLNFVFEKRIGIPITLSIIYVEAAKNLNLKFRIVGFPSHVLVKFNEEIILDPFNNGRKLTRDDLQNLLDKNIGRGIELRSEFLHEIGQEKILIRLARNLKNSYLQSYAFDKALLCTNMILGFDPNSFEDIRDKGILEEKLENHTVSLKFLNRYLQLNPNGEDIDFILGLINKIRKKLNQ